MTDELITIPRDQYQTMTTRLIWLDALERAGVDEWEGFEKACKIAFDIKREQLDPSKDIDSNDSTEEGC